VERIGLERVELFVGEDHPLTLLVLVASNEVVPVHLVTLLADAVVVDARAVLLVKEVEFDLLGTSDRGVELDGDRDETEGDRATPDRSGHTAALPSAP
jgi:hypothetical protein